MAVGATDYQYDANSNVTSDGRHTYGFDASNRLTTVDGGGYHANGRGTPGDSMIVDPWGVVLDRLPRGSGVVMADIERSRIEAIRRNFPALEHRRLPCTLP